MRYQYKEEINVLYRVAQLLSSRVKVTIKLRLIFNSKQISIHSYAMLHDPGQSFLTTRVNWQNENNNKDKCYLKTVVEFLFYNRNYSKSFKCVYL